MKHAQIGDMIRCEGQACVMIVLGFKHRRWVEIELLCEEERKHEWEYYTVWNAAESHLQEIKSTHVIEIIKS